MIIDCHTHISSGEGNVETSEHFAAAETVNACIVLAQPSDSEKTSGKSVKDPNKQLSDYVGRYKEKMIGFAYVNPLVDKINEKKITELREKLGLKGAVVYCSDCGFHPAHSDAMRFYQIADELGFAVFFHNAGFSLSSGAVLEYAQPYMLDEVAREFPSLKIIIGNMGVPFYEQALLIASRHENVYADLTIRPNNTWQTYNMVVTAHEYGVMDKLLFGSGFPAARSQECIETLLGINMLLGDTGLPAVPRGSIKNIIERNSLKLLGIEHEVVKTPSQEVHSATNKKQ